MCRKMRGRISSTYSEQNLKTNKTKCNIPQPVLTFIQYMNCGDSFQLLTQETSLRGVWQARGAEATSEVAPEVLHASLLSEALAAFMYDRRRSSKLSTPSLLPVF